MTLTKNFQESRTKQPEIMAEQQPEVKKHIKQLENENNKLRKLLKTALEVANKDSASFMRLKLESEVLESEISNLEKEKQQLEDTMASIKTEGAHPHKLQQIIYSLEKEHVDLRCRLEQVLTEIRKGYLEIDQLKSEDAELKKTILKLENDKKNLLAKFNLDPSSEVKGDLVGSYAAIETKEESIKRQPKFIKPVGGPISIADIIKDRLYMELQETIAKSSEEINQMKGSISSDPDISKLIKDIEIQKEILLNNLKLLKIKEANDTNPDEPASSDNSLPPASKSSKSSEIETATIDFALSDEEDASEFARLSKEKLNLNRVVSQLESERAILVQRLQSLSEPSASGPHDTFVREASSERIVKKYDDATNQLYDNDEQRLEQRIRELEAENNRIIGELEALMGQISEETARSPPKVTCRLKEQINNMEKLELP
ncbi:unnamed protein product [Phyllotreta striolata]|uniref:Uncharacterized protein n=1 Tax=Phyllotreta striolata TaxID=444603 RepID=A0A9P0DK09_PHYSR|nr:unnamed protein product [Phyllotreta striolata]